MSGDITVEGHGFHAVYGFPGERYILCDCGVRFDGVSLAEVTDLHRQHVEAIHDAVTAPQRREAAKRDLDRAWDALADAVDRKRATA